MLVDMKRIYGLTGLLVATVATAVITYPHPVKGEFDYVSLNNQVQNHEQRITNLENKIDPQAPSASPTDGGSVGSSPSTTTTTTSGGTTELASSPSPAPAPEPSVTWSPNPTPQPQQNTSVPTRQELSDLFASIAPAGEQRSDKTSACYQLFAQRQRPHSEAQSVCSDLSDYSTY